MERRRDELGARRPIRREAPPLVTLADPRPLPEVLGIGHGHVGNRRPEILAPSTGVRIRERIFSESRNCSVSRTRRCSRLCRLHAIHTREFSFGQGRTLAWARGRHYDLSPQEPGAGSLPTLGSTLGGCSPSRGYLGGRQRNSKSGPRSRLPQRSKDSKAPRRRAGETRARRIVRVYTDTLIGTGARR